jgi:putative colanic acid biosynthesis acetyltransferase WcaF
VKQVDLSTFSNPTFSPGAGVLKRILWYLCGAVFIDSHALLPYSFKRSILRSFGAHIANGVVVKPKVNIKYPWKLSVGENSWIGEGVWIDNLDFVSIGSNACLSQGALILSGNHDYSSTSFDLIIKPIKIENGAWIGAKAVVTQGVIVGANAVLSVGSVASSNIEPNGIYRGNPAQKVKDRVLR